jgi:hypothetical protein
MPKLPPDTNHEHNLSRQPGDEDKERGEGSPSPGLPPASGLQRPQSGAVSVGDAFRKSLASQVVTPVSKDLKTGKFTEGSGWPQSVIDAVHIEWQAGLKSLTQLSVDMGVPRTTISTWARENQWGDRRSAMQARLKEAIDSTVVSAAAKAFRAEQGLDPLPPTSSGDQLRAELEAIAADAQDEDAPAAQSELVMQDYSASVAQVVSIHTRMASTSREVGEGLMERYKAGVKALARKHATKGKEIEFMKMLGSIATSYATLSRAIKLAIETEREAMGIDRTPPGDTPPGDGPLAGGNAPVTQPGSYEDIVRQAEARGERLQ